MTKFPSIPVAAPMDKSGKIILAPARASPVDASITVPVILPVCAKSILKMLANTSRSLLIFFRFPTTCPRKQLVCSNNLLTNLLSLET